MSPNLSKFIGGLPKKGPTMKQRLHRDASDHYDEDLMAPSITARESAMRTHTSKPLKSDAETLVVSEKDEVKFKTGSSYKGGWNTLGMAGNGEYHMFHGVLYEGKLDDGKFHGKGVIWYPNNSRVEGVWYKGRNIEKKYYFNDGLPFDEKKWTYCQQPDRRFRKEMKSGIRSTGRTLLSNRIPARPIPPGCYDVGDGFYSPVTKCVTHPQTGRILRIPPRSQEKWILENCRKSSGLDMYVPTRKPSITFFDEKPEKRKSDEEFGVSTVVQPIIKPVEEKEPKMAHKSVGRFDLLHKKVQQRAYSSKYILVDELRNRACKRHRLYLPALRVKTKVNIIPDLRVIPPFRCMHDSKAILVNKLVLLLKMLKDSDKAGGINLVSPESLKRHKQEFLQLLYDEKKTKNVEVRGSDFSRQSVAKALSYLSLYSEGAESLMSTHIPQRSKVLSFIEGAEKRSVIRASEHKALRAKELTMMLKEQPFDSSYTSIRSSIVESQVDVRPKYSSLVRIKPSKQEPHECDVCIGEERDKADELMRKEKISQMISQAEEEEERTRQQEILEYILIEKEIERIAKEEITPKKIDDQEEEIFVRHLSIDPEQMKSIKEDKTYDDLYPSSSHKSISEDEEGEITESEPRSYESDTENENEDDIKIGTITDYEEGEEAAFLAFSDFSTDNEEPPIQPIIEEASKQNNADTETQNIYETKLINVKENEDLHSGSDIKMKTTYESSGFSDLTPKEISDLSDATPDSKPVTPVSEISQMESDRSSIDTERF